MPSVQGAVLAVSDGTLAHLENDTGVFVNIKKPGVLLLSVPADSPHTTWDFFPGEKGMKECSSCQLQEP